MRYTIHSAAVLGSGVMGSRIAALLAGAGISVLLLDRASEGEDRLAGVKANLAALEKSKPAALYRKSDLDRITIGTFEDDAAKLSGVDWILEAIVEYMPAKEALYRNVVAPHAGGHTIISSNTSGLSVTAMSLCLPEEMRSRFVGVHFFNPPRYLRLVEVIPASATAPDVQEAISSFLSGRLGKGVVLAKDTPNFVANRIGIYAMLAAVRHMTELGLSIETVDAAHGAATARPKTAVFGTADLVGIDTLVHVAKNSATLLTDDDERSIFTLPEFLTAMVEKNLLGGKSGGGFYRKEKSADGPTVRLSYDWVTGEYRAFEKPDYPSLSQAKLIEDPAERLRTMLSGSDAAAECAWLGIRDLILYTIKRIPEIADSVHTIDNAMRWGFSWELGPFELLDAIGVKQFIARIEADGLPVPELLNGVEHIYRRDAGVTYVRNLLTGAESAISVPEKSIGITVLKERGNIIEKSANASLLDAGDGVLLFALHGKMNAIGGDVLAMARRSVERAEKEGVALLVAGSGKLFSAGANLGLLAAAIAEGEFHDINRMIKAFQAATMAFKYAKVPVVAAPFQMALGGGAEFVMHSHAAVAHVETYMGLVEIGVGLLPAGGGTKEMALRAEKLAAEYDTQVAPFIFKYFKQIGMAKVSMSAFELFDMNYLNGASRVTFNAETQLGEAKRLALSLAESFVPALPRTDIRAAGTGVAASIKSSLWNLKEGGQVTKYDAEIASLIADVITGGAVPAGTPLTEEYYLELEREAFLKLCGRKETAARILHMLKTGKPLRN